MKEAIKLGGLKADGKIISADGSLVVTKAAIEPAQPQVDTAARDGQPTEHVAATRRRGQQRIRCGSVGAA